MTYSLINDPGNESPKQVVVGLGGAPVDWGKLISVCAAIHKWSCEPGSIGVLRKHALSDEPSPKGPFLAIRRTEHIWVELTCPDGPAFPFVNEIERCGKILSEKVINGRFILETPPERLLDIVGSCVQVLTQRVYVCLNISNEYQTSLLLPCLEGIAFWRPQSGYRHVSIFHRGVGSKLARSLGLPRAAPFTALDCFVRLERNRARVCWPGGSVKRIQELQSLLNGEVGRGRVPTSVCE